MFGQQISNSIPIELNSLGIFSGIFLAESGQISIPAGFQDSLNTKEILRLVFVSSGKGVFRRDGKDIILQQNDVYFQSTNIIDTFFTEADTPVNLWYIDMYGNGVESLIKALGITRDNSIIRGMSSNLLFHELKQIVLHSHNNSLAGNMNIISGLYQILAILLESGTNSEWDKVMYSDKKILYTGTWTAWPSPFDSNNNECYTSTPRAYAEYNFCGSGIKWFGTMNFDCGKADVIIDGIYQTTIDTYSPTRLTQQLLYINTALTNGNHIIKIFCTGDKNDKASNCDVVIESFQHFQQNNNVSKKNTLRETSPCSQMTTKAELYMKSNYMQNISIAEMASLLKVSRSYFTNRFTAEKGISPLQFLVSIRIDQAKYLLANTNSSIAQVAIEVGYSDSFYFSNLFRKRENVSPSQYRTLNSVVNK